jgi:hypothetical protein
MDSINFVPILIVFVAAYVFYESFTAINEMDKAKVRHAFREFKNPYTLKYWGMGLYAIGIMSHANEITGWNALLIAPAILCVMPRTFYRANQFQYLTDFQQFVRFRYFLVAGLATLLLFVVAIAKAEEAPKAIEDCDWKPTQATGVYYKCEDTVNGVPKKLVGEGVVTIHICGKPYYLEIDCRPKVVQ